MDLQSSKLCGSSSRSKESNASSQIVQVTESVYQLYKPAGRPSIQIVFFHGLQPGSYEDAHLSAWKCEDGSCIWPQTWLVDEIPQAHVFSVSCGRGLRNSSHGRIDMFVLAENLTSDLLEADIGQRSNCPIVLVGHSIGGLIIKELCCQAHNQLHRTRGFERIRLANFLKRMRGVFYYATPHHGSSVVERLADKIGDALLKYFKTLSTDTERLNSAFDTICKVHEEWHFAGLGEGRPTKLGWLNGEVMVVTEASARGDNFNIVEGAEHFSICKPTSQTSRSFSKLKAFLIHIANEFKEEAHPQIFQRLPKHITGIDGQLKQTKAMLKDNTTLGLVGMGGLGKTTLAKAIFNELCPSFEYTCFVHDVKHISGTVDMVMDRVWSCMNRNGKKVGTGESTSWSSKEVLLVLDDISGDRDENVLLDIADLTSSQSRFIVTSRERDCVQRLGIIYDVQQLNDSNAYNLFVSHAFPNHAIPPTDFAGLTKAIVAKCEGLPLTLEVLGQYLKMTRDVQVWEQVVHSVDQAEAVSNFNERLWEKLMPSYNGLGEKEKQMFLDAATIYGGNYGQGWDKELFRSWTLREAKAVWREAYGVSERLMWKTLVDRSLVYDVAEDDCIQMHQQIRSLGRKEAAEACKHGLPRVWENTLGLKLLENTNEIIKDIHALRVRLDDNSELELVASSHMPTAFVTPAVLDSLKNVHFLDVDFPVAIDGFQQSEPFLRKLVLLRCVGSVLFSPAFQTHLVVLHLAVYTKTFLPNSIGQLSALRFFCLGAPILQNLPDGIGNLTQLERLEFVNCYRLKRMPETFSQLTQLKHLRFSLCWRLLALPDSFGFLPAVEHLDFHSCRELLAMPESFGRLSRLSHLSFKGCGKLQLLPESFGHLNSLKYLYFDRSDHGEGCDGLSSLPESFGLLRALEHLVFRSCSKLGSLPKSFGLLSALTHLEFRDCCQLHALPESFGQLSRLRHLEFYNCGDLQSLPESFGLLSALVDLTFYDCDSLETLPASFGNLSALKNFALVCEKVNALPESFGQLSALSRLTLECCRLQNLPEAFGSLRSLCHLKLNYCDDLHSLPKSFGQLRSLQSLKIYVHHEALGRLFDSMAENSLLYMIHCTTSMETIPDNLKELQLLHILELGIAKDPSGSNSRWTVFFDMRRDYKVVKEVVRDYVGFAPWYWL